MRASKEKKQDIDYFSYLVLCLSSSYFVCLKYVPGVTLCLFFVFF